MKSKTITTVLEIFDKVTELPKSDQQLLKSANEALSDSHSPYSKFQVAAALLLENGNIITGTNFENASYPLCLCAERSAIAAARSQFASEVVVSMAVTAKNDRGDLQFPVTPCGACRQVLLEVEQLQQSPIRLILNGQKHTYWVLHKAKDLLPLAFDSSLL